MARLIVEDGGRRRAFRVGDGVVTVGSGEAASLRVEAADVADVHAEIAVRRGEAVIRPKPGVVPPRIGGREVRRETVLPPGCEVALGESVRLRLEALDPAAAPSEAGASAVPPAAGIAAAATGAPRSRSVVQRTRPRIRKGLPGPVVALLVLGVVGGLLLVLALVLESEQGAGPVAATIRAAEERIASGNLNQAESKLDEITPSTDATPDERRRIAALRSEIAALREQRALDIEHMVGTQYLDTKLKKYEQEYLQGDPEVARVREFFERTAEFRRRWSKHPEMDWVERQESRFRGAFDLSQPVTFEDVAWRVKSVTKTSPRDYKTAFAELDAFLEEASGADRRSALELRDSLLAEREEYHLDRLKQARWEYDKQDERKAVWWLVQSIAKIGDPEMADEAARILVEMPNLEGHLLGYKSRYPELFEALMENDVVRAAAVERGLL